MDLKMSIATQLKSFEAEKAYWSVVVYIYYSKLNTTTIQ
jgi:hypothetical protein